MHEAVDACGRRFPSFAAMCRFHGVPPETGRSRRFRGKSAIEALQPGRGVVDHTGTRYASVRDMCAVWGVRRVTYYVRIRRGMSQEQALTGGEGCYQPRTQEDHTGRAFPTFDAMCAAWGRDPSTVRYRLRRGMPLASALTTPAAKRGRYREVQSDRR